MTDWERLLTVMDMNTWLDLNPCECEALCTCDQPKDSL